MGCFDSINYCNCFCGKCVNQLVKKANDMTKKNLKIHLPRKAGCFEIFVAKLN